MRERLVASLAVLAMLALLVVAPGAPAVRAQQAGCQTFPQTGKTVCGKFLAYWNAHGGLAQQGYPISAEMKEVSEVNGKEYTVQYFERAVFELHPENAAPYDVLLSLLGSSFYKQRYPNGATELPPPANPVAGRTFPQTGKEVRGVFLDYWNAHGGLAQQGYPISNQLREKSAVDGKEYVVQYFERAVFELHPELQPPYNVLLSQLGTLQYKRKYGGGTPPPAPSGDMWAALEARPLRIPAQSPENSCIPSTSKVVSPDFGAALGGGPAYPVGLGTDGTLYFSGALQEGGWYLIKVLWISDPGYMGPILVRGKQVDGLSEIRFGEGPNPANELRLDATGSANRTGSGWGNWPGYTRLKGPGCYAYQVDGTNFTQIITFKAFNQMPPPP